MHTAHLLKGSVEEPHNVNYAVIACNLCIEFVSVSSIRYDTIRYMICTGKLTGKLPV